MVLSFIFCRDFRDTPISHAVGFPALYKLDEEDELYDGDNKDRLHKGDDIYYTDIDKGCVEHGIVCSAVYIDGQLRAFCVDFDDGCFDVLEGIGFGTHYFKTENEAKIALKQHRDN